MSAETESAASTAPPAADAANDNAVNENNVQVRELEESPVPGLHAEVPAAFIK